MDKVIAVPAAAERAAAEPTKVGRPLNQTSRCLTAVLLLLAFSTFLFGLHWLVLLLCVARTRNERIQCTVHFAVGLVAFLMLGGGGAYARSGTSTACSNNQSMSRECLWEEQTPTYQGIYILHFVGGAWILASVVVDGLHMPGWFYCIVRRTPMRSFYTSNSPWPAYTLVMIVLVTVVNFTWTGCACVV